MIITPVGGVVLGQSGVVPLASYMQATNDGDLVLVGVTLVGGTGHTVSSVTDANGNTWAIVGHVDNGIDYVALFACWAITTPGVSALTVNTTYTGGITIQVAEFTTDVPVTWSLDGSVSDTYNASAVADAPYPTLTPSIANELFVSVAILEGGNPSISDTNPYEGWSAYANQIFNYNINVGPASVPYTAVAAYGEANGSYAMVSALIKAVPTGATPTGPLAPTLTSPLPDQSIPAASGFDFMWDYNTQGAPPETGYQFRQKVGAGSYSYWNAATSSWSSTPVTNSPSNNSVAPIPASQFVNGTTYDWSVASVDSSGGGPFAADGSFDCAAGPTVSVTAPTGTYSASCFPTVTWSVTYTGGATQASYRVVTYPQAQYTAPDFVPGVNAGVDDSGWLTGTATSYTLANGLLQGSVCQSYFFVIQTPGLQQNDAYTSYTINATTPSAPTINVAAVTTPISGVPAIAITVHDTNTGGVSATGVVILRSDGVYVTGATPANPAAITAGGTIVVYDYEASGQTSYTYEAWCIH